MKHFERFHPVLLFFYFLSLILITMLTMNPILLIILYLSGIIFSAILLGFKSLLKSLAFSLPIMLIIAVTNPLFNHRGVTVWFYINDHPVTMEATVYGLFTSVMLMAMFYWFKCYSYIFSSDKFIFLFGRVLPKLSLLLSLILGFIPKMKTKFREIDGAQKALGIYSSGSFVDLIKSKMRVLSILLTYSLENSLDTADSMRARGYSLRGRTSFSMFKWNTRDTVMSVIVAFFSIASIVFMLLGYADFYYYPEISRFDLTLVPILLYSNVFILAFIATATEIKEGLKWNYLKSKI